MALSIVISSRQNIPLDRSAEGWTAKMSRNLGLARIFQQAGFKRDDLYQEEM